TTSRPGRWIARGRKNVEKGRRKRFARRRACLAYSMRDRVAALNRRSTRFRRLLGWREREAAMDLDAKVCLCFRVTRRKLLNFIRVEHPRVASQLSQCGGAGTGCGWCVPYPQKLFAGREE